MLKKLKKFTLNLLVGANVAVGLLMCLVGYSDRLHPAEHPMLANIGLTFPLFVVVNLGFILLWSVISPKRVVIPIIAFVLAYAPVRTYVPINILTREMPDSTIKVMSFNVKGFLAMTDSTSGITTRPALSAVVRADADIVCLQETGITSFLEDSIRSQYQYYDSCRNGKSGSALTVLSKYPIIGKELIAYPSESNSSAAFFLDVEGDTVLVVNNHFEKTGLSPEDRSEFHHIVEGTTATDTARVESQRLIVILGEASRIRSRQADIVARYIRDHSHLPIILCGDFNDSPISYTHHLLTRQLDDCFVATGNGPGWTYMDSRMYVRIDNILCSEHFRPYRCRIETKTIGSDHFPVVCWLKKTWK